MKKKPMPKKKGGGGRPCLALTILALIAFNVALAIATPVKAHAADVPLFSAQRLSIAAQAGLEWERRTDTDANAARIPSAKLVPVYKLWGPAGGHEGGSVALVTPVQLGLDADHKLRYGAFLSICLWSGADQAVAVTP